jgi:hypothetical protein
VVRVVGLDWPSRKQGDWQPQRQADEIAQTAQAQAQGFCMKILQHLRGKFGEPRTRPTRHQVYAQP